MTKKLVLLVVLMVAGVVCWQVMEAEAQRAGGTQRQGIQRGRGVDVAAVITFLNEQGLKAEAQQLAALQKDPAKAQEMNALAQRYNTVMRSMQRDPAAGKLSVDGLKCELEIEKLVKAGGASLKKNLTGAVGKLFDVIIAQQEARTVVEPTQSPGEQQQRAGRGTVGQQRGMGRGMSPQQIAELKANIAGWKKNKAAIVNLRVQELMLGVASFPWAAQTSGFRIF